MFFKTITKKCGTQFLLAYFFVMSKMIIEPPALSHLGGIEFCNVRN
jgi:hypothetical protein